MRGVLYLASTSPRREDLLRRAGIGFELHPPGPEPRGSGSPLDRARQRARSKAVRARPRPQGLVLGVDTVVVAEPGWGEADPSLGGEEFGKPSGRDEARAMLRRLAGREHLVLTAHCLLDTRSRSLLEDHTTARVRCDPLSAEQIEAYLDGGDWTGKAGGYGIQGDASAFMALVHGELDTVIGLNVAAVRRLIDALGVAR